MQKYLFLILFFCLGAATPPTTSKKYYTDRNFNGLDLYLLEKSYLQDADGSNTLEFRAPDDLLDDNTKFILPETNGNRGQYLTTDGSGNLYYSDGPIVVKSSTYTAIPRDNLGVDTSGGIFTIDCPASPEDGEWFEIYDVSGTFYVNNLTLDGNGNNIQGVSADYIFDISYDHARIVFVNSTIGWMVY